MTATTRFSVDQLLEVPAQAVAVHEILKGTFDAEIAKIKQLRDELAGRQAVDDTFAKAQDAHVQAALAQSQAAQELADAKEWAAALRTQLNSEKERIEALAKETEDKAARTETARVLFEAERKNATDLMDGRSAALDLRESQLAAMASKIGEGQRDLALEKEAFNRKLEALKV